MNNATSKEVNTIPGVVVGAVDKTSAFEDSSTYSMSSSV
jgi:hypothetical protein